MNEIRRGSVPCQCRQDGHAPKLIAVTGGPGAGKTAVLEMATRVFCRHVLILPEAASVVFTNGFPRKNGEIAKATQRVIYHWQRELERVTLLSEGDASVILCDRGTLDGLAYWNGDERSFFEQFSTTRDEQLARYAAVVHLHTPDALNGYNHQNHVRNETPEEAKVLDERIMACWAGHANRIEVHNHVDFMTKAADALRVIRGELPECCSTLA